MQIVDMINELEQLPLTRVAVNMGPGPHSIVSQKYGTNWGRIQLRYAMQLLARDSAPAELSRFERPCRSLHAD